MNSLNLPMPLSYPHRRMTRRRGAAMEALLLIDAQDVEALQSVWKLYCEQGDKRKCFARWTGCPGCHECT